MLGDEGNEVGEHERAHAQDDQRERRYRGERHGVDLLRKQDPEFSAQRECRAECPRRPPSATEALACQAIARTHLAAGEAQSFEQGQVTSTQSNRRGDGQSKGDGHPDRKGQRQPQGRAAHRAIVNDLGGILDVQDRDRVALSRIIRHRRELGVSRPSGLGHDGEPLFVRHAAAKSNEVHVVAPEKLLRANRLAQCRGLRARVDDAPDAH